MEPFALSPWEYEEVKAWWAAGHPGAVASDLGVGCWNDWVQVILNPAAFAQRIGAVDWTAFHTAYGRADGVPNQLLQLASPDKAMALKASDELSSGLCHQHVQVGSAALPAFPFILEVMEAADDALEYEILDIILGLAKGVNRKRHVDFRKSIGREPLPDPEWVIALRGLLVNAADRFKALGAHSNADVAESAHSILQELSAGE